MPQSPAYEAEATATDPDPRRRGPSADAELAPHLFLVLQCDTPQAGGARSSLAAVDEVVITRGNERALSRETTPDGRVLTIRIPGKLVSREHARMKRVLDHWVLVDEGSTNGVFVNGKKTARITLAERDVIECGRTLFVFRKKMPVDPAAPTDLDLGPQALSAMPLPTLLPDLAARTDVLRRVAASKLPLLVVGDSGTGKEVVARTVASMSGRTGDFVPVSCGSIQPGLLERQLFGSVDGAGEPGLFRAADGGTLFLDEIGDLPLASQSAFLRVIEDGVVVPVGASRGTTVDVRVIAATHRPLGELTKGGTFRADLLARLATFVEQLPPLRERREDLGILIAQLLPQLVTAGEPPRLTVEAATHLLGHPWPLNIRELRGALASALVIANGEPIDAAHLQLPAADTATSREHSRERLISVLTEHRGNVASVARAFGKAPAQIHRWLKQYGLDVNSFRDPKEGG